MSNSICKNCGKQYHALPSEIKRGRRACSRKCQYLLAHTGTKINKCIVCGKNFWARLRDIERGNRGKYCSLLCYRNSQVVNRFVKRCNWCKKEITASLSDIKYGRKRFCSKICASKSLVKEIERTCKRCGNKFMINPSKLLRKGWGTGTFCSMNCRRNQIGKCLSCGKEKEIRTLSAMCLDCYRKNYDYKRKYGITLEKVKKEKIKGCQICHSMEKLFIDHDHATGKYRGILCSACNFVLGFGKDNPNIFNNAINYLR